MNLITIKESNMIFGEFDQDFCFEIEKSATYKKLQNYIKIADFLWLKPKKNKKQIWIIEAKESSPDPKNKEKFEQSINDICEKMINSLMLTLAMCLKRHSDWQELPLEFQKLDLTTIQFKCILVIKGHEEKWLPPLQDALKKQLQAPIKTFALDINGVVVINDEKAQKKYNLIKNIISS